MNKTFEQTYAYYKKMQIHRSETKWGSHAFWDNIIYFKNVVLEVQRIYGIPKSICCMGIRNGNEYKGFQETIGFKDTIIYGVDINPNVIKVGSNCFSLDFSKLPMEWGKKFDWIYSNSLDHAFNVKEALIEWHRVCKNYLILVLSSCKKITSTDIYDFELKDVETLFDKKLFKVLKIWNFIKIKNEFVILLKVI